MTIAIPRLDRTTAADRGLTLADFLVPIPVGERLNARVRHVLLIAAGALFIYLTARVTIPRDPVPWTAQTFGILVVAGALGARRGFAAVALYVLLGLVGLPFFAEGKGGTAVLLGPTGGYLIGFLVAGILVGRLAELGWDRRIGGAVAMMALGTLVIYAIGLPWLSASRHLSVGDTISAGLTPFIAWDAAKILVAGGIFPVAWWLIGRRPDDR
ncbi:MAG: biotin transporter BioY [Chloroflexota bacterium]